MSRRGVDTRGVTTIPRTPNPSHPECPILRLLQFVLTYLVPERCIPYTHLLQCRTCLWESGRSKVMAGSGLPSWGPLDPSSEEITPQEFRSFLKKLNGDCAAALENFKWRSEQGRLRQHRSGSPNPGKPAESSSPRGEGSKKQGDSQASWIRAPASIYAEKRERWEARRRQLCKEPEPILVSSRCVRLEGPPAWGVEFSGIDPRERVIRPEAGFAEPTHQEPLLWERRLGQLRKTLPESFCKDKRIELHRPLSPPQLPRLRVRQVCPYLGGGRQLPGDAGAALGLLSARWQQSQAPSQSHDVTGIRTGGISGSPRDLIPAETGKNEGRGGWTLCSEGGILTLGGRACTRRSVAPAHTRGDGPERVKVTTDLQDRLEWRRTQWCTMIGTPLLKGPCVLMDQSSPSRGCRGFEVEVELAEGYKDGTRPQLHIGLTTVSAFKAAKCCTESTSEPPIVPKELMEVCANALGDGWLLSTNGHGYRRGVQEFVGGLKPERVHASAISFQQDGPEETQEPVRWPDRWRSRPLRGKRSVRTLRLALHAEGNMELSVEHEPFLLTKADFVPSNITQYQTLVPVIGSGRNVRMVELLGTF